MEEAIKVLNSIEDLKINYNQNLVGGAAIDELGSALPDETLKACEQSDAILFGSVGGPKWESLPPQQQPERGALLPLRKHFDLYANLRPSKCFAELTHSSPLKENIISGGFDVLCVRELTAGIYFGQPKGISTQGNQKIATDTMVYKSEEIERIAHIAFKSAMQRNKKLTSIDKANVLQNGLLWREIVNEISKDYSEVELEHLYVDNAAMQVLRRTKDFDVLLAPNLFGDILSDELAMLSGSLGMLASASLGKANEDGSYFGMYEPSGGSAPDIAGKKIANPIAQILSASLMLRYSFNLNKIADKIDQAVKKSITQGFRTADIFTSSSNEIKLNTTEMGDKIVEEIGKL